MNKNQSIGMYVILGIMVLAFISMLFSGPTSSTEELSYTAFLQKVENKEIKSVDMGKDALIALPVKQPEAKKTNSNPLYGEVRPPKLQYKVVLPENSDVLSKLEQNDVEISAKRANEFELRIWHGFIFNNNSAGFRFHNAYYKIDSGRRLLRQCLLAKAELKCF